MNKYKIKIVEKLAKEVVVEANDISEAIEKVEDMYYDSKVILYPEDLAEVNFVPISIKR